MENKTIIIATIMRPVGETGVQTHVNSFKKYAAENNYKVILITPYSSANWLLYPIFGFRKIADIISGPLSVWWYRWWHYYFLKLALKKVVETEENIVFYAQCPLSAKAAISVRKNSQQKVTMIVHFNISQADEWREKGKIKFSDRVYNLIKSQEKKIIPQVDKIVFVSNFMRTVLEESFPELKTKADIAIIPNFIFPLSENKLKTVSNDLINIGSLENRKNQFFLLRVLYEAKLLGRNITLSIVGDGPDLSFLKMKAKELEILNLVTFTGFIPEASKLLSNHKIYIHSAVMENLPVVIIEALSVGLPVLAPSVGGISEQFVDGVSGFFIDLENPKQTALKIIDILSDRKLYQTLSENALLQYTNVYNTNEIGQRLVNFILD